DDAHHVSRSLRMAAGEQITDCDGNGMDYQCELIAFLPDCVRARILESRVTETEPPYEAVVWQALPKGEKLDSIIQKSVECGASKIALFESERCIVRVKDSDRDRKGDRRNRIALEAAKQCGRGTVPSVAPPVSFDEAVKEAAKADLAIFCYEGEGTAPLPQILKELRADRSVGSHPSISVMVGSEGGFSKAEAESARAAGMRLTGLGKRILRTETAAAFVLGCLSYELEL
ncbi:MAG: 16S rRNA (uracil(1498)-N(3))-methyltransferase, partial [Clostridia bacterium]|nr:16S rRNA (uracil(1498)-N(3))-methyltransferase [Clostridia bacterium]